MKNTDRYTTWIAAQTEDPQGRCAEATLAMQAAFPELRRVRGHVITAGRDRPHWWLVTPDGDIIDPTAAQFQTLCFYQPWDEAQSEPTGKCPNCGGYVFDGGTVCSETCAREYAAYCVTACRF
jgi:hypothetical protein